MPSFDVVSKANLQEVDNAFNQAKKEISTRYDFQGTLTDLAMGEDKASFLLKSSSEGRLLAAVDVLQSKLVKRGVSLRFLETGEVDSAALGQVKQTLSLVQGIPMEKAKDLIRIVKDSKLKVQASIQADQLRITGKSKDDLQNAIALLKQQQDPLNIELQFNNFRD
ncbi:MAG TPA: YajQ family cyclic di-GMP-binding protein [Myxococcaceae bacterium]|nr:YajQ family cyclic di-GMP-binding protein [Myxococcaceae bacterium]